MYKQLINDKRSDMTFIRKWEEIERQFSNTDWKSIFELHFKTAQESKLQLLQFQILLLSQNKNH